MFRFGRVQQREDALRGRHAVHRDVEIRAELSQRNEEVGGQQNRQHHRGERRQIQRDQAEQHAGRFHRTGREPPYRDGDAGRGPTVRDRVHRRKRAQLDLQHVHGRHTELLGLLVHDVRGAGVGVEGLQCFQALQVVEERGAHVRVFAPVFFEHAGGSHGHHADDEHDERRADEQRRRGGQVDRREHHEQCYGCEDGVEQLRQEQFEEALDLFDAFARGLHHVGGAHALRVGRAEREHLVEQLLTQGEFDAFGGFGAEARGGAGCGESHDRGRHGDRQAHCGGRTDGREQWLQHAYHRHDEGDVGHQAQPLADDLRRNQPADAVSQGKQPFVEHSIPFIVIGLTAAEARPCDRFDASFPAYRASRRKTMAFAANRG